MEDLKCQHCGSVNLDLDHIFPSCLECYHFLPNITRKAAINAILADFIKDFPKCLVRNRRQAAKHSCKRLRSGKHDHLALMPDELGNVFVLTKQGQRLQLIGDKEIAVGTFKLYGW